MCGGGSFVRLPHDNASLLPPPLPPPLFSVRFHHATGEKREEEEEEDGTEPAMRSGENSTIRTRSKKILKNIFYFLKKYTVIFSALRNMVNSVQEGGEGRP